MLARIAAMGGKGLSPAQLNEISQDVKESQQRMLDGQRNRPSQGPVKINCR